MKNLSLFSAVCLAFLLVAGCSEKDSITTVDEEVALKNALVAGKYIVVLKSDASIVHSGLAGRNGKVKAKAQGLLNKYVITGVVEEVYETALQGFTVKMAPGKAKKLAQDLNVKYVEADRVISLSPIELNGKPSPKSAVQSKPWGITRVNGGESGVGKRAWIIDSGIDLDHPDLTVDVAKSKSFLGKNSTADDQNGHGTHVAGIIAAKANAFGVIGVAPGATVIAVRVLDRKGSGSTSGVIAGVNYVAANGVAGDVANMSLGSGVSTSLDEAVMEASKTVSFVLAAGNESDNADNHSPGRVNGTSIYTVSAMDYADKFAYFSNFGIPPVDYCAPGVLIYSTYKNGGYASLSGTSMAAPHVAGILLLGAVRADSFVQSDPDGKPDPIAEH